MKSYIVIFFLLFSFKIINADEQTEKSSYPQDTFSCQTGSFLLGEIVNDHYYSPSGLFSCQADSFGEEDYITQDFCTSEINGVAFYSSCGHHKKIEIFTMPSIPKSKDKKRLMCFFENVGIGILKSLDDAQGIRILKEEMLDEDTLFIAISIDKLSVLQIDDRYPPVTKGYLIYEKDKYVFLLSNQRVTKGKIHNPEKNIDFLKKGLVELKNSICLPL